MQLDDFLHMYTVIGPTHRSRYRTFLSFQECLGGSVGCVSDFSSGHGLPVHELEPCTGFSAVTIEPTLDPLSPSLSAPPPLALSVSLKINKLLKK